MDMRSPDTFSIDRLIGARAVVLEANPEREDEIL
jgi:hypothetical protein